MTSFLTRLKPTRLSAFITNQLVSDNLAGVSLASSEIGASAGTALSAAGTLAKEADRPEREVAAFLSQIRAA